MTQHYKTLMALLFLIVSISRLQAQITVDATAGTASGSYTTLKGACDAINLGTHQGIIDIRVHASTTETVACSLVESGNVSGAIYSAITLRPADTATVEKVLSFTTSGSSHITLAGSDNVTFDGRPGGLGTSKLLRLAHTAATANSHSISVTNGVNALLIRYCSFTHAATTAVVASNILLSASVAPLPPNSNIKIQNCLFTGARANIYFSSTAANPMDSIEIVRNEFVNFANAAVLSTTGSFKKVLIDSNVMYNTVGSATAPTAIDIRHNALGTVLTITRNHIYDIQTATTNFIRGIVVSPATAATGTVILVANNYISLMKDGGSGANIRGFEFGGAGDAICRFINNSIRIGGTHTGGTAGQVVSIGIFKSNTSTLSTWVCRNNVSINNRTGGTAGLFHSAGWVSGNGTGFVGTYDIDYNIYWATGGASNGPFPAVWNGTLQPQTGQTAYRNAATPSEQHSIFGNVTFVSLIDLTLTGASINDFLNLGAPRNANVLADYYNVTRGNPTYKGAHESTPFTNLKDAAVKEVYTLGKLPIPYANPHTIRANIQNTGIDTLFNQKVRVNVTGVNVFADSVFIDTIVPGQNKYAVFTPYSYLSTGTSVVTVTVPGDSTNSNNSKAFNQVATSGTYAYAEPTAPAVGGVGFNGVGGDFIAKFPYTGSNNINQVGVNFNTGGQPFQIVIYSVVNDTPGVLLWNSPTQTAVTGVNTINVNPIVPVSGSFFVGVRQTGTTNVGFGYQVEDPIRNGVFYYKATTVTAWNDFASTNSAFRFMVEPRLQIADDIGVQSVISPCNVVVVNSPPIFPKVKVFNYGLNGYSSTTVKYTITGPVASSGTTLFPSISLSSNTSAELTMSTSFNPTTAGTYTMKIWTELLGDLEPNNDTVTYVFTVADINTSTNSGNHIVLNGTNQSATVANNGSLDFSGSMLTLEAWANPGTSGFKYILSREQSSGVSQYDLYMNLLGNIIFKVKTLNGTDSVVSATTIPVLSHSHIAGVYDGTNLILYINGEVAGTKPLSGTLMFSGNPLFIGQSFTGAATSFWGGSLDDVKIWDTARTESQIRSGLHTRTANFASPFLKGYWRMDEAGGAYIADAAGNCNNGIINNAATFAVSNVTMGTPSVDGTSVGSSGITTFPNTGVAINLVNQAGTNQYYVHRFTGTPKGTSPVTSPGGVINVSNNTWFIYKYGTGTMDSSFVDFSVGSGVPTTPVLTDIKLFNRAVGSDGNWLKLRDSAYSMSFASQKISMIIYPAELNKQFVLGANSSALPVKLVYFNGKRSDADVQLTWVTASETDNAGFTVERSVNGKSFEKVTRVEGQGNSNETNHYNITDENAFANANSKVLYYRLVQTDFSGKETISQTVIVNADNEDETITAMYPNPFTNELTLTIDSKVQTAANILVMDVAGKTIATLTQNLHTGMNTIETSQLSQLPKGIYMVQLNINGHLTNHKLVKQ
ncbi:MAG: LamG-like jellyroll fold domain-containing protein [Bacteroidota bacterium]